MGRAIAESKQMEMGTSDGCRPFVLCRGGSRVGLIVGVLYEIRTITKFKINSRLRNPRASEYVYSVFSDLLHEF